MTRGRVRAAASLLVALAVACSAPTQEVPTTPGLRTEVVDGVTRYTNRLIAEKSPYLQQHAHNPVDWYPWGEEAFERARRENKPIFLSIGYSACHWCHVMETESFSNPDIAALMNRYFVSIKVDREERPDVDRVYLAYVNSVSGGGWPMSLFLTPDRRPFYGATYMPPEARGGEEGFRNVLQRMATAWESDRPALLKAAADGTGTVTATSVLPRPSADEGATTVAALDQTFDGFLRSFDATNGGFSGAPKFPRTVVLSFLLRQHARTGDARARDMVVATLEAMAKGAIHDQLGGGFHRYTVDAAWRVPHFEKMLYDQALMATAYTEAYQLTRNATLGEVARRTLAYALSDLRGPAGGFYSSEDADSPVAAGDTRLAEGAYYLWSLADVRRIVGPELADAVVYHYGLLDRGPIDGLNPLAVNHSVGETASYLRQPEARVTRQLDEAHRRLLAARQARPRPARDEKVIAAWNGLMISALARAAQVFDDQTYLEAALSAARFVESRMYDPSTGTLKRSARQDTVSVDALLEDYAFMIQGLLDVFETTSDRRWIEMAIRLQDAQDRGFHDDAGGAYFSTRADAEHLLARMKEDYDGAEPAANSVSAMNLVRLWQLTENDGWRARADATFAALSGRVARSGTAVPQLMAALDFRRATTKQIVVAGNPAAADTQALLRLVHDRFIPNKVVVVADGGRGQTELATVVPFVSAMAARNGKATVYVCENYVCRLPTSDPATALKLLATR